MKVINLRGLFSNIANDTPAHRRGYHKLCLDEVYAHIQGVLDGEFTLTEFAEHYCIRPSADETMIAPQPSNSAAKA